VRVAASANASRRSRTITRYSGWSAPDRAAVGRRVPGRSTSCSIGEERRMARAFTFDHHFRQYGRIQVLGLTR
jgi:hypothetical protein